MNVAALDLGSNSFHLLVARVGRRGELEKLGSSKVMLRLAEVVAARGTIPEFHLAQALSAIGELAGRARRFGATRIVAAGTSALREAANGGELARRAAERFGLHVGILTGDEEAELVYAGARSRLEGQPGRLLVIDLGGGSVELALGDGSTCLDRQSLPLGFLRVRAALGLGDSLDGHSLARVREHVTAEARPALARLSAYGPRRVALSGGTARALGRIAENLGVTEPSGAGLRRLALHLASRDREHLIALGVQEDRLSGFGAGIAVIAHLIELAGVESVSVTRGGLREGLLLREYQRVAAARAPRHAGFSAQEGLLGG